MARRWVIGLRDLLCPSLFLCIQHETQSADRLAAHSLETQSKRHEMVRGRKRPRAL